MNNWLRDLGFCRREANYSLFIIQLFAELFCLEVSWSRCSAVGSGCGSGRGYARHVDRSLDGERCADGEHADYDSECPSCLFDEVCGLAVSKILVSA